MGSCQSCDATAAVSPATETAMAKVVFEDGRLEEYARAVRVAHVLQKSPACFVCDSDDMEPGDFLSPVAAGEDLRPGKLYFLLPVPMLRHRLQAEDLATLAVRASGALMKGCRRLPMEPPPPPPMVVEDEEEEEPKKRRRRRRGGSGRSFASSLSSIPELGSDGC